MQAECAPIALFVYKRLEHLSLVINGLLANPEAKRSDLIIFSDAARSGSDKPKVDQVRDYISKIQGFSSVKIYKSRSNLGLSKSIIRGVTKVLEDYERIIVLEDDTVPSPDFLAYANEGLRLYALDDRVISIHGYNYPVKEKMPDAFFLRGADCWGWATWRRGWALFNPDGDELMRTLVKLGVKKEFDFGDTYMFSEMLQAQVDGRNDSWAIRWYASAFLENKLTLYPGESLIQNIGNDCSGEHCVSDKTWDTALAPFSPKNLNCLKVRESQYAKSTIARYFASVQFSRKQRFFNLIKRYIRLG